VLKDPKLKQLVLEDMYELAVQNRFNSLEKPKGLTLLLDPFTVEGDLLTPTMKLKRNVAKKVFAAEIEAMYQESPEGVNATKSGAQV